MSTEKTFAGLLLHYLVRAPAVVASIAAVLCLYLLTSASNAEQKTIALMVSFTLSELLMIISALGGVIYLLSAEKQHNWLRVNIGLFFAAGFSGVFAFLAL